MKRFVGVLLVSVLSLFGSGSVMAQEDCRILLRMETLPQGSVFPERLRFSREVPQPYTLLDSATMALSGDELILQARFYEIADPAVFGPFEVELPSSLPPGEYRVRTDATRVGRPCPVQLFRLNIGGVSTAIPATSTISLSLLIALMALSSLIWMRREIRS